MEQREAVSSVGMDAFVKDGYTVIRELFLPMKPKGFARIRSISSSA
jgi:hypothetical protein